MPKAKAEETAVAGATGDIKMIDGQAAVRIESPLEHWPGHIYVPREMTPEQFDTWFVNNNTAAPDECTAERKHYIDRQHLILEWHIEGIEPHHITPDGKKLPSVQLFGLVTAATIPVIDKALSLPNLPGWWNKRASGES